MDRLQRAFKRQILPADLADNDRINENTISNNSSIASQHELDKEKPGILGILGLKDSPKGKDLKKLEQETLAKGKIQKIEELPLMENMSDHTSSQFTNDLIS